MNKHSSDHGKAVSMSLEATTTTNSNILNTNNTINIAGQVHSLAREHTPIYVKCSTVARKKSGIQAPTLYPRDSEIKALNLSAKQVDSYMCVQRVHQNNVEFLSCYFPIMILAMLGYPTETFYASIVVFLGRMVTAIGYYSGAEKRVAG